MRDVQDTLTVIFLLASAAIAVGFFAMPVLVFRQLPLTRTVKFFSWIAMTGAGITFGALSVLAAINFNNGTQGDSSNTAALLWTFEFVASAVGTWGFILSFHTMLRAAAKRRATAAAETPAVGDGEQRPREGGEQW